MESGDTGQHNTEDGVNSAEQQSTEDEGIGEDGKLGLGRTYVPWNSEEEEALRLGVMKHGIGAWQIILRDPEFGILT